jgi:N6-adenosine-specific RNA methylase IME4
MPLVITIPETLAPVDRIGWAGRIRVAWNKTREGVIEVGRLLTEAKEGLEHGEFEAMVSNDLPFAPNTAQIFMKIARDPRLSNPQHVELLPPSWGTLYELSKLDDGTFDHAITKGLIRPDMERKDAERLRTGERRAARLARTERLSQASPPPKNLTVAGRRYPVVYADPPWKFETYGAETGQENAAENHYPTLGYAELAALPVGELAATDAVLFLWATGPQLWAALQLMAAWGFVYKARCAWAKCNADGTPHRGAGYWFIDCHEELLVGTRGNFPAPLPGSQMLSLIEGPIGRHSAKPALFRELIDRSFPGVGKIELFARGGLRGGWDGWGNEA